MKKPSLFLSTLACLALFFVACGGSKNIRNTEIPDNFYVEISKGACFGTCPIFDISVDASGEVVYRPERFAPDSTEFQQNLSKKDLKALVHLLKSANLNKYKSAYDNPNISDLPMTELACKMDDYDRSIQMRSDVPPELTTLIEEVLEMLRK